MDFERNWKKTACSFLCVTLIYFAGAIVCKTCEWTEMPMKCTWYSTALKCMAVPLFASGVLEYKSKTIESRIYMCVQSLFLCLTILFLSLFIGACSKECNNLICVPAGMICLKLEIMALVTACILMFISFVQLYIIFQMKKYELED